MELVAEREEAEFLNHYWLNMVVPRVSLVVVRQVLESGYLVLDEGHGKKGSLPKSGLDDAIELDRAKTQSLKPFI